MKTGLIERLRIYFNYGVAGFLITLLLIYGLSEAGMFILPMIFNLIVWKRLKRDGGSGEKLKIALTSGILTTGIFFIQWNYKHHMDYGACIKLIPRDEASISYAYTMIFFSIVIWEIGIELVHRMKKKMI